MIYFDTCILVITLCNGCVNEASHGDISFSRQKPMFDRTNDNIFMDDIYFMSTSL